MHPSIEDKARESLRELREIKAALSNHDGKFINQKTFLGKVEKTSKSWFNEIKPGIKGINVDTAAIQRFDDHFGKLLKLSSGNNLKSSFLSHTKKILKEFQDEVIIPIQTNHNYDSKNSEFEELLDKVIDKEENEYLTEALGCLKSDHKKASVVLGWCACIDRIHRKIEEIGFTTFNSTSVNLANQTSGRFKRFNKKFSIASISDLREVFDNDILWIIEGMGLIDSNQHVRLKGCFDMRCHSAHPGQAPVTRLNILSFFSDIVEIVLSNRKFEVNKSPTQHTSTQQNV